MPHNVLYDTSWGRGVKEALQHQNATVKGELSTGGQINAFRLPKLMADRTATVIVCEANRYRVVVTERLTRLQLTDGDMFVFNRRNGG